jgi:hypothetical protein
MGHSRCGEKYEHEVKKLARCRFVSTSVAFGMVQSRGKKLFHSPNPMWRVNPGNRAAASSAAGCLKFREYPGRSLEDDGTGISNMSGWTNCSNRSAQVGLIVLYIKGPSSSSSGRKWFLLSSLLLHDDNKLEQRHPSPMYGFGTDSRLNHTHTGS